MGAVRWCSTRESIEKGEVSLLAIVETLLAVALLVTLSLYTISCTLLITWHEGRLVENLHRLWDSIGKRVLP